MNAIFVTQSGTIKMFHDLALDLQRKMKVSNIGMVVSHRRSVKAFEKHHPDHQLNQFNSWPSSGNNIDDIISQIKRVMLHWIINQMLNQRTL